MAKVIETRPAMTDRTNWTVVIASTVLTNRRHNFSTLLSELSMKLVLRRLEAWLDRVHEAWVP